ncbi:MAG: efflux RND transporter permease subunit [Nitrospiraceae bacterium]
MRIHSFFDLERHATVIVEQAKHLPGLTDVNTNVELNKPELAVSIHRDKAADLGIAVATVGRTLETLLGGRRVTTFIRDGKAYNVMVKIRDRDRVKPSSR